MDYNNENSVGIKHKDWGVKLIPPAVHLGHPPPKSDPNAGQAVRDVRFSYQRPYYSNASSFFQSTQAKDSS